MTQQSFGSSTWLVKSSIPDRRPWPLSTYKRRTDIGALEVQSTLVLLQLLSSYLFLSGHGRSVTLILRSNMKKKTFFLIRYNTENGYQLATYALLDTICMRTVKKDWMDIFLSFFFPFFLSSFFSFFLSFLMSFYILMLSVLLHI